MSDLFKFEPKPGSGALAAGASRMGALASAVKDQQLERIQSGLRRPESEVYVASPEEAWSKKYMIQCVGPVCTVRPTEAGALLLPRFQPAPETQAAAQSVEIVQIPVPTPAIVVPMAAPERLAAPPASGPEAAPRTREEGQPIGVLIGKNVRKRSLLGRMFGR